MRQLIVITFSIASSNASFGLKSEPCLDSRESLAGRFERLTLSHWNAASLVSAFGFTEAEAADEIVTRGAARCGLTWHFARPPVQGLEYEMDCRRVTREIVI